MPHTDRSTSLLVINTINPPNSGNYDGPPFLVVSSPAPAPRESAPFRVSASLWPAPDVPVEFGIVPDSGFRFHYDTERLIACRPDAALGLSFRGSPYDRRDELGFWDDDVPQQLTGLLGALELALPPQLIDLISVMAETEHMSHSTNASATHVCYFFRPEDYYVLMLTLYQVACSMAGVRFEAELVLAAMTQWWAGARSNSHFSDHLDVLARLMRELSAG